jgi:hypothetical protein
MLDHRNHHTPRSFVEFAFYNEAFEEVVPIENSAVAVGNMIEVEPCAILT